MYYLNLPLEIWQYILIVVIIIIGIIIFLVFRNPEIHSYLKMISVWLGILLELNFISMYYTLKVYLEKQKVVGSKGPVGDPGPRGFRGSSFVCNQCGIAGQDTEDIYGSNINDNNEKVNDDKLQIGKCKFPFVHNNEFHYECTTEPREEGSYNDADTYGWCATSINNDLSYKTFGYCKNSDIEKKRLQANKTRLNKQQKYFETNYGLLDLKVVEGLNSRVKCESGYKKISTDLNSLADGKYIYLCTKTGLGDTGISDITIVEDNETCPVGYKKIPKNLNQDAGGKELYICKKSVDKNFIKNIKVVKENRCPDDYTLIDKNLNQDAGGDNLYLCTSNIHKLNTIIDTAFVWQDDNQLYFFKGENYWKYDDKKQMMAENYPKKINSFWGRIPKSIDAVFTSIYDNNTYFFKGDLYYMYDSKRMQIAKGYPKYIKNNWKGVPNNLDAIYTDYNRRITYFIKGKYYYKYNYKNNRVSAGYPKIFNRKWPDAPSNISAMFYYPFNENTYIIQTNRVYEVKEDNTMSSNSPMKMSEQFPGIA